MGLKLNKIAVLFFVLAAPSAFAFPYDPKVPVAAGFVHVSRGDQVLLHKAVGDTRVSEDAPFPIASVSKHFLARVVRNLIQAGKLRADTPISAIIPELRDSTATVTDLLEHRGGINDYDYTRYSDDSYGNFNCEDFSRFHLRHAERFNYSNVGFCILARATEILTGRKYSELLQEEVLNPAGMTKTYAAETTSHHPELIGSTDSWDGKILTKTAQPEHFFGSAGIVTTPNELAKWQGTLRNYFSSAELGEFRARLEKSGESEIYEWGLEISLLNNGKLLLSHTGKIEGHLTYMAYVPEDDFYMYILIDYESDQQLMYGAGALLFQFENNQANNTN